MGETSREAMVVGEQGLTNTRKIEHGQVFVVEDGRELTWDTPPEEILAVDDKLVATMLKNAIRILEAQGVTNETAEAIEHVLTIAHVAVTKLGHDYAEVAAELAPFRDRNWLAKVRDLAVAIVADTLGTEAGQGAVVLQRGALRAEKKESSNLRRLGELYSLAMGVRAQVLTQLDRAMRESNPGYKMAANGYNRRSDQIRECHKILDGLRTAERTENDVVEKGVFRLRASKISDAAKDKIPQFLEIYNGYKKEFPELPEPAEHTVVFLFESLESKLEKTRRAEEADMQALREEEFTRLLKQE